MFSGHSLIEYLISPKYFVGILILKKMIYDTDIALLLTHFISAQTVKIYFRDDHKFISHLTALFRGVILLVW